MSEADIWKLKVAIEVAESPENNLLKALEQLQATGPLTVEILKKTKIGRTLNTLANTTPYEKVRLLAKELEAVWRRAYREWAAIKRKKDQLDLEMTSKLTSPTIGYPDSHESQNSEASLPKKPRVSAEHNSETGQLISALRRDVRRLLSEALAACCRFCKQQAQSYATISRPCASDDLSIRVVTHGKDPTLLSVEIETALHDQMSSPKEYKSQARAVSFNLKDEQNIAFGSKLLLGEISPVQVPKLTAEEMASDAKKQLRKQVRNEAMAAVNTDKDSAHEQSNAGGMFACEQCQSTNTTNFQIPSGKPDSAPTIVVLCAACGFRSNIQDKEC